MKKYSNEKEILNDFENGKINKWEKNLQLAKLGKNAKYFSDEGLMCMYCDNLYDCDNNWEDYGKEKLKECNELRKKGVDMSMSTNHEKIINDILKISEKYQFEYLYEDNDVNKVILEYVGDDVIIKSEDEFEDLIEYKKYYDVQRNIVSGHFIELIDEFKKENIKIKNYEYDYDFLCVHVYY